MNSNFIWDLRLMIPSALAAGLLCWNLVYAVPAMFETLRESLVSQAEREATRMFWFFDFALAFRLYIAVLTLAGVVVWLFTGRIFAGMLVPLLTAGLPTFVWKVMRVRRLRRFDEQLPDALMVIAGSLRAGLGLPAALQQMTAEARAPLSQEFGLLLRERRLGTVFDLCLYNLSQRVPTESTILMVSAMRVAMESGGNLAESLERISTTLRMRLHMEGKIRALTSQGRMQAWVVGALPMLVLVLMSQMAPDLTSVFWTTRVGWVALGAIFTLEILGVLAVRKIVQIKV